MKSTVSALALAALIVVGSPAHAKKAKKDAAPAQSAAPSAPSATDADKFVAEAEKELFAYSVLNSRAQWVNGSFITDDTDAIAAEFGARGTEMGVRYAKGAAKFDHVEGLSYDTRR